MNIKKRKYTKKVPDTEEICDTYISNFQKENDLKLNNYFKRLNQSIQTGFTELTSEIGNLAKYLKYNSAVGQKKAIKSETNDSPVECSPAKKLCVSKEPFLSQSNQHTVYNRTFRPLIAEQCSSRASSGYLGFQNDFARAQSGSQLGQIRFYDQEEENFRRQQWYESQHDTQNFHDTHSFDGYSRYARCDEKISRPESIGIKRVDTNNNDLSAQKTPPTSEVVEESPKSNLTPSSAKSASNNDTVHDVVHIKRLVNQAKSHTHCATLLLLEFFDHDELKKEDVNVTGNSFNGKQKNKLDEEKMEIIKQHCIDRLPQGVNAEDGWKECIKAMHKVLYDLRNGRIKNDI